MRRWEANRVFGFGLVFVTVLVIYLRTMAASTSFWDCGEFIACAHILGIPHPPGAPLHGLLGRLFSLLPLFETVARRVNFLSALTGALAAGTLFLVVERVARGWFGEGQGWRGRLVAMVGGVAAGLWMAFSDTFWSNAVEAEVYAPAMFLMVLITWLGLRWQQLRDQKGGDQVLLLLVYLLFLGIAVHLTVFLIGPAIFLLVMITDLQRLKDWRLWLAAAAMGMVVASLGGPFLACLGAVLALSLVGMSLGSAENRRRWQFCFWLMLAVFTAYSVQAFIPLRSALDPIIDENDPENWKRFMYYLERKQYGQESMLQLMFHRKGSWANQFGVHPRMGFWGFFRQGWAPLAWWPLVLVLGLVGMVVGWFRERRTWWYLLVLMMLSSAVIVLWMNFSDGTRGVQLEVRDRDYFFTPTYVYFSLWMGLGVSGLLWLVLRRLRGLAAGVVFWVLAVVLLVGPLGTMAYNYHRHDRSRNYIARDYGYNLLVSCDRDGILFTNGDNDTFPLWYLQEVEGIRRDVRVVNLSLLNTAWYIKQLKYMEPKVPIDLSDSQIDRLMAVRLKDGSLVRIQDQMVREIISANDWQRPIFFAVTIPEENRVGLDDHFQMEAMVYRLMPEERENRMDMERIRRNLNDLYLYRSMGDPTVYKDDNAIRLLYNISSAFLGLASEYYNLGDTEQATSQLQKATQLLDGDWRPHAFLAEIIGKSGDYATAVEELNRAIALSPDYFLLYRMRGTYQTRMGKSDEAIVSYQEAYRLSPTSRPVVMELADLYFAQRRTEEAQSLLRDWLSRYPQDAAAKSLLQQGLRAPEATSP